MDKQKDDLDLFGHFMVSEMRKMTNTTIRNVAKAEIMDILVRYGMLNSQNVASSSSLAESTDDIFSHQNQEIDINIPPEQNSPKNIMNILNGDCLQAIFVKIKDVYDLWSTAKVCTRFQKNVIACFPFKELRFGYHSGENAVKFDDAASFLSVFGSKIKSIVFTTSYSDHTSAEHKKNLNLIAKYCGKTLNRLDICGTGITHNLCMPMQALKRLLLSDDSFHNFASTFPEMEFLRFKNHKTGPHLELIKNHFPKLRTFALYSESLTNDIFIEFQKRNPQLETLVIGNYKNLASSIWESIADNLPNISTLRILNIKSISEYQYGPEIAHISRLRNLSYLELWETTPRQFGMIKLLFSSLITCKQPIEIKMLTYDRDYIDTEIAELLANINSLKYLRMTGLYLYSLSELITIMAGAKQLVEISLYYRQHPFPRFDPKEFESVVALATGKIKVKIFYKGDALSNVPNDYNGWVFFIKF